MFRAGSRVEEDAENDNVRIMLMVWTSHHRNTAAAPSATVAVLQDIELIIFTDIGILV